MSSPMSDLRQMGLLYAGEAPLCCRQYDHTADFRISEYTPFSYSKSRRSRRDVPVGFVCSFFNFHSAFVSLIPRLPSPLPLSHRRGAGFMLRLDDCTFPKWVRFVIFDRYPLFWSPLTTGLELRIEYPISDRRARFRRELTARLFPKEVIIYKGSGVTINPKLVAIL
jgi:hypothetical protein